VETWELAGERDWTYTYLSYYGYKLAQQVMGGFWDTMDRMGKNRNPYRAGYSQQICVSETDERAKEEYLEHVLYFFNKCMHVAPWFREAPGYRTRRSTEFAIKTNRTAELVRMATMEKNWDSLTENGLIIAGSPATVADRLIEAAKTLHVGNLVALLQIGSMPHELTEKNITLFAEEVLPRIRGQWADQGWQHNWWATGAADRTPAVTGRA
jgi:alkanesulfonate monooxygenase SsuD/methylene tetrahydromethanopterin reductase-like flavin-dependent oxidoreductase (luciferase family)